MKSRYIIILLLYIYIYSFFYCPARCIIAMLEESGLDSPHGDVRRSPHARCTHLITPHISTLVSPPNPPVLAMPARTYRARGQCANATTPRAPLPWNELSRTRFHHIDADAMYTRLPSYWRRRTGTCTAQWPCPAKGEAAYAVAVQASARGDTHMRLAKLAYTATTRSIYLSI